MPEPITMSVLASIYAAREARDLYRDLTSGRRNAKSLVEKWQYEIAVLEAMEERGLSFDDLVEKTSSYRRGFILASMLCVLLTIAIAVLVLNS